MQKQITTFSHSILILFIAFASLHCGTYSLLRPADNLKKGEIELSGGVTFSSAPQILFAAQANYGITNWLEVGGQYEMYSAFGWLRFGPLNSKDHGIALALSAGAGYATVFTGFETKDFWDIFADPQTEKGAAVFGGLTLGRQWNWYELYVGSRAIPVFMELGTYVITSVKMGHRFTIKKNFFINLEGGAAFHHNLLVLGEGAVTIGAKF